MSPELNDCGAGDPVERAVATRFAPRIRFDADELWYPTDPRAYVVDGVVSGFRALNAYTAERNREGAPPNPTVFYRIVGSDDPNGEPALASDLVSVSYWLYHAFDQFAFNFHWHDSEAYHVLCDARDVDADAGAEAAAAAIEPVVRITDPHAGMATNAELGDRGADLADRLTLYSELGAHALAPGATAAPSFRRFDGDDDVYAGGGWDGADVSNRALALTGDATDEIGGIAGTDLIVDAYGLPREETKAYTPRMTGELIVDALELGPPERAFDAATPEASPGRRPADHEHLVGWLEERVREEALEQLVPWVVRCYLARPDRKRELLGLVLAGGSPTPGYRTPYLCGDPLIEHPCIDVRGSDLIEDPGSERSLDDSHTFVPPGESGPVTYCLRHTDHIRPTEVTFTDAEHTPKLEYGPGTAGDTGDAEDAGRPGDPVERLLADLGGDVVSGVIDGFRRSIADPWTRDWWDDPTAAVATERTAELLRERFGVAVDPGRGRINAGLVGAGDAAPAGGRDHDTDR